MPTSRRKQKSKFQQNQKQPTTMSVNIVFPNSLSAEEMQQIIANALLTVEHAKEQKVEKQKEQERKEWEETVGHNPIKRIFKILFLSKNKIKGDKTTFALLKMFVEMFFGFARILTLLFSIFIIAYIPLQYIVNTIPDLPIVQNIFLGMYAVLSFIFSRMFRMAAIEVDKIEDRNLLLGIFASITSIVSIVVAVIAVIK